MAITDIKQFAHLTASDVEALGAELDALRREVESSLGARDAAYIRKSIGAQRASYMLSRLLLWGSRGPRHRGTWLAGTAMLAVAKSIENMELGHNVTHGQWDWMNDPEVHSTTWEWDMLCPSSHWKHSHNYAHHKYTNVIGMDNDIGFGILRMTRDEQWKPMHLLQPFQNLLLALTFEWGIALHDIKIRQSFARGNKYPDQRFKVRELGDKLGRQLFKDYVLYPALSGNAWKSTLKANVSANVLRNLWAYVVIFCGHFPDGAEKFTMDELENETRGEWYLRQMLGTANFNAGPVLAFMSGNLCYQIEHHLFPDLPSNRYAAMSVRVRELCDKYDLPYTTGSLIKQYTLTLRTIHKLALPNKFLIATSDDAPETSSERRFAGWSAPKVDPASGRRAGLKTAIAAVRRARRA